MIEKIIIKKSITIFIFGLLGLGIVGIISGDYTLPVGFSLGYVISIFTLLITSKFTDIVLQLQAKTALLSGTMFVSKLGLYALGLWIAMRLPMWFHYMGVVIGYFVTKITIYILAFKNKGGEWGAN